MSVVWSVLWGALGLAALLLVGLAALWAGQDRLIYFPDRSRPDASAVSLPGLIEEEIVTEDGLRLLAWRVPPARSDGPVLLYLHGNGGNLGHRAGRVRAIAARGWGLLMVEWRGYGGNPGRPSEDGLQRDARAGLARLAALGARADRIVLYGESLGTGVAVRLASEAPGRVAALVLESPYTSLKDLAALHYPVLPARLLLRDGHDSRSRIGAVAAPILILAGGRDRLVPAAMGRSLAAAAPRAEIWEAPEGGHEDLAFHGAFDAVAVFLARTPGARAEAGAGP